MDTLQNIPLGKVVEATGFEPVTPCLQSRCSPAELSPHEELIIPTRPENTLGTRIELACSIEGRSPSCRTFNFGNQRHPLIGVVEHDRKPFEKVLPDVAGKEVFGEHPFLLGRKRDVDVFKPLT